MSELNLATSLAMVLIKTGGLAVAMRLKACLAVRHESAAGVNGILPTNRGKDCIQGVSRYKLGVPRLTSCIPFFAKC